MRPKGAKAATGGAINLATITTILGFVTALFGVAEVLYRTDVVEGRSPVERVQRAVVGGGGESAGGGDGEPSGGDTTNEPTTSPESSGSPSLPDLEITSTTSESITVANNGTGPANPFVVQVNGTEDIPFEGLDAEASETRDVPCNVLARTATVDPDDQIEESDETNNSQEIPGGVC